METQKGKRLMMVGIRRKGEKKFKTMIRKDIEMPLPPVSTFHPKSASVTPAGGHATEQNAV